MQLLIIATRLAEFSAPYAPRKMRVRIAQALGIVSPRARALKSMFALRCLVDGLEGRAQTASLDRGGKTFGVLTYLLQIDLCSLPMLMKDQALPCLATTSEDPRLVLSSVRMLIQSLMHVHDVVDVVGDAGLRDKDVRLSEAEARKPDWEVRRRAARVWRGEMLDALRWLKMGMCESALSAP